MNLMAKLLLKMENVNSLGVTPNPVIGVLTPKRGFIEAPKGKKCQRCKKVIQSSDLICPSCNKGVFYE